MDIWLSIINRHRYHLAPLKYYSLGASHSCFVENASMPVMEYWRWYGQPPCGYISITWLKICKIIVTWQTVFLFLRDQVECSHCCCVHVVDADHLPAESASTTRHDRTWRRCAVWCFLDRLCVICPISTGQTLNTETLHFGRCHRTWIKILPNAWHICCSFLNHYKLLWFIHTASYWDQDQYR